MTGHKGKFESWLSEHFKREIKVEVISDGAFVGNDVKKTSTKIEENLNKALKVFQAESFQKIDYEE